MTASPARHPAPVQRTRRSTRIVAALLTSLVIAIAGAILWAGESPARAADAAAAVTVLMIWALTESTIQVHDEQDASDLGLHVVSGTVLALLLAMCVIVTVHGTGAF